jgi:hypothetical protein
MIYHPFVPGFHFEEFAIGLPRPVSGSTIRKLCLLERAFGARESPWGFTEVRTNLAVSELFRNALWLNYLEKPSEFGFWLAGSLGLSEPKAVLCRN